MLVPYTHTHNSKCSHFKLHSFPTADVSKLTHLCERSRSQAKWKLERSAHQNSCWNAEKSKLALQPWQPEKLQCPVLMWSVAGSRDSSSGSTPVPGTPAGIWCISGACSGAHLNPGSQSLKLKAKSRDKLLSAFLHNEDMDLFITPALKKYVW